MRYFSISYDNAKICKECLEKLSKDLNKIKKLFARIPCNSYSGKQIKI